MELNTEKERENGPAATKPEWPRHLLVEKPPYQPGIKRVSVDRYFKQSYHDREVEAIWKKTWQWACREEDIPEIGDHTLYEVAELSFIVVRTAENEFKAYWNSCPHRGRKICTFAGKRATEFRCMFHGWAWNIDGSMAEMAGGNDFAGARPEEVRMSEVKAGSWGGYVFINPDPDAEPLADFLGELPAQFEGAGHDLAKRWVQVHVVAHLPANWKVVQEAFLEAWHVPATHPQLLAAPISGRGPQRWDDFGNFMRSAYAPATGDEKPSYRKGTAETPQQLVDQQWDYHLNEESPFKVGPDENGVTVIKETMREFQRMALGDRIDDYHDYHLNSGEMLSLWPNFHPWQGFSRLMYRFRPYRNNPDQSLMDVLLLSPWPEDKPRPPAATPTFVGLGESISKARELGNLSRIFMQDLANIPHVHEGLKSSGNRYVIFSNHNEAPLRRWHDQYDRCLGITEADGEAEGDAAGQGGAA